MFHRLLIAFDVTNAGLTVMTVAPEPPDWAVATGYTAPVNCPGT